VADATFESVVGDPQSPEAMILKAMAQKHFRADERDGRYGPSAAARQALVIR
jgi:hypothetical protein